MPIIKVIGLQLVISNGIIIQYGFINNSSTTDDYSVTFPTSFSNTNYSIVRTHFQRSGGSISDSYDSIKTKSVGSFTCPCYTTNKSHWLAIGN